MRGWHQLASVFTQSGISLNVLCSVLVLPNTRDEQNCYVLEQRALEGEERSWSIICLSTAVSLLPTSFLPQSAPTLFKPQYPGQGLHWYIFDTRALPWGSPDNPRPYFCVWDKVSPLLSSSVCHSPSFRNPLPLLMESSTVFSCLLSGPKSHLHSFVLLSGRLRTLPSLRPPVVFVCIGSVLSFHF